MNRWNKHLAWLGLGIAIFAGQQANGQETGPAAPLHFVGLSGVDLLTPDARLADLSARFAAARRKSQVLSCGHHELALMYQAMLQLGFRNSRTEKDLEQIFRDWAKDQPRDPSPLVALSGLEIKRAWNARGSGGAATVSAEQMRSFQDHLAIAGKLCDQALALKIPDPRLYQLLITIGMGSGLDRPEVQPWSDACCKEFPISCTR